jgi:tRNA(adenine34) deaminase
LSNAHDDEGWMRLALQWAERGSRLGEVPVGAVVVQHAEGQMLGSGHNLRETWGDPSAHAEIVALRRAARRRGDWQLAGCTLYCTLEPCPMCVGAALAARIERIVYGAPSPEAGAVDSLVPLADFPGMGQRCRTNGGVLAEESATLLRQFFEQQRLKKT